MIAVSLALELLLITGTGFFARKLNIVKDAFSKELTSFLINIILPCLVFTSVTAQPFSMEKLRNCAIMLLLSVIVCALQLGMGHVMFILSGRNDHGRLLRYGMTIPHFSFMGIPVVDALFGATGNMYYAIFLIPVRLLYFGASKSLLIPASPDGSNHVSVRSLLKSLLSPGLIVIPVAMVFWFLGWQLPGPVDACIDSLSGLGSPLGLILCGVSLGRYSIKTLVSLRYFKLPIIRTIIMPIIFLGISRVMLLCGVDPMSAKIVVVFSALPIAAMLPSFAMQYMADEKIHFEAAGNMFLATLMSMFTLPFWYYILTILP